MILSDRFIQLVGNPVAAIWASNCNEQLEPELVRLLGAQAEADKEHLLLYVPLKFGKNLIHNFAATDKLTFLLASLLTFESYQLKGSYLSHRACTPAEVKYQKAYFQGLGVAMERLGLPKEKALDAYYHQPSVAVRLQVMEVYEQTPKAGTGEKVLSV
jgi:hypothetical protein